MATQTTPSPELFFETMFAFQRTAALKAAIDLELFTAIGDGAHRVAEIAARCRSSERGVRILCDNLTIMGFLAKTGDAYELTPDSSLFLTKRSPAYLGSAADFLFSSESVHNFERLAEIVRTGVLPAEANTVADNNPVWVQFARAMAPSMTPQANAIADALAVDSAGPVRVIDIAAGHGMFGITIAKRNPKAEIVAVDWAPVLAVAKENAEAMGVADRFRMLSGDAFKVDYGAGFDIALMTNFLHHFDRPTCVRLLRKVAAALTNNGRIAVLEFVPNDDHVSPPLAAGFSLTMLGGTPGGEAYTFAEHRDMLAEAGFRDVTAHPLPVLETILVATRT
jgi:ubiquinone/menaquinone biosynthesis C-methylase UbiE